METEFLFSASVFLSDSYRFAEFKYFFSRQITVYMKNIISVIPDNTQLAFFEFRYNIFLIVFIEIKFIAFKINILIGILCILTKIDIINQEDFLWQS